MIRTIEQMRKMSSSEIREMAEENFIILERAKVKKKKKLHLTKEEQYLYNNYLKVKKKWGIDSDAKAFNFELE